MKRSLLLLAPSVLLLTACSSSGDEIVFDTTLGPETDDQIEGLPGTLHGDTDNARYSNEDLKGKGMESKETIEPAVKRKLKIGCASMLMLPVLLVYAYALIFGYFSNKGGEPAVVTAA